jgi:hypothetical protein
MLHGRSLLALLFAQPAQFLADAAVDLADNPRKCFCYCLVDVHATSSDAIHFGDAVPRSKTHKFLFRSQRTLRNHFACKLRDAGYARAARCARSSSAAFRTM